MTSARPLARAVQGHRITRDELLLKLGAARKDAGRAWVLMDINLPAIDQPVNDSTLTFSINKDKLRVVRPGEVLDHADGRREGPDP